MTLGRFSVILSRPSTSTTFRLPFNCDLGDLLLYLSFLTLVSCRSSCLQSSFEVPLLVLLHICVSYGLASAWCEAVKLRLTSLSSRLRGLSFRLDSIPTSEPDALLLLCLSLFPPLCLSLSLFLVPFRLSASRPDLRFRGSGERDLLINLDPDLERDRDRLSS